MNLKFKNTALRTEKNVKTAIDFYNQFANSNDYKVDLTISERVTISGETYIDNTTTLQLDGFSLKLKGKGIIKN